MKKQQHFVTFFEWYGASNCVLILGDRLYFSAAVTIEVNGMETALNIYIRKIKPGELRNRQKAIKGLCCTDNKKTC